LIKKGIPNQFWTKAVNTSVYLLNRLFTKALQDKTLYEAWNDIKPPEHHLTTFGCICYFHMPQFKRIKLDNKAQKDISMDMVHCLKATGFSV